MLNDEAVEKCMSYIIITFSVLCYPYDHCQFHLPITHPQFLLQCLQVFCFIHDMQSNQFISKLNIFLIELNLLFMQSLIGWKLNIFEMQSDLLVEKEALREEFELLSSNIKSIMLRRRQKLTSYEKDFILNLIKKVKFIKQSFDTDSPKFAQIFQGLALAFHDKNQMLFDKGDEGELFYIVLEGAYCVETEIIKDGKKDRPIYYYSSDSFGEVSLIYNVPRGTRIVANQRSCAITINKQAFNLYGNLSKNILALNQFFAEHPYFENQDIFMRRVVSSMSRLVTFDKNQILVDEGTLFDEILFIKQGEIKVYITLQLQNSLSVFYETIQIDTLTNGDVFGQYFYANKIPSNVRIVSTSKGSLIKVRFQEDVNSIENQLYKRIKQNAERYPNNQEILHQYKVYLQEKYQKLRFVASIYKDDKSKMKKAEEAKKQLNNIRMARILHDI